MILPMFESLNRIFDDFLILDYGCLFYLLESFVGHFPPLLSLSLFFTAILRLRFRFKIVIFFSMAWKDQKIANALMNARVINRCRYVMQAKCVSLCVGVLLCTKCTE